MTIRVYLVDDHALVRTGMKMILSGETDIEVVGEAETGEDALRDVRQLLPDVVLCDLHLPGVSGMEVTERIVRSHRNTRVVIVSVLEDGPLPKRLLEAGAAGYIGKGCDAQELLRRGARCGGRPALPGHQHRAEPGAVDRGRQRFAVRQPVAARAGGGAAADPGPAPGTSRGA
jgi:DNA-binding NarL/FixJ family response regulator